MPVLTTDASVIQTVIDTQRAEISRLRDRSVSKAMAAYLRVCSSGGMPKHLREQVQRSVDEAERLGYFDAPPAED